MASGSEDNGQTAGSSVILDKSQHRSTVLSYDDLRLCGKHAPSTRAKTGLRSLFSYADLQL